MFFQIYNRNKTGWKAQMEANSKRVAFLPKSNNHQIIIFVLSPTTYPYAPQPIFAKQIRTHLLPAKHPFLHLFHARSVRKLRIASPVLTLDAIASLLILPGVPSVLGQTFDLAHTQQISRLTYRSLNIHNNNNNNDIGGLGFFLPHRTH